MIALTSVVKDEIDCIEYMIEHHIQLGIRSFFIYDNNSTDGTYELLEKYIGQRGLDFHLYHDPEENHFQSFKMTRLAQVAYNHVNWFILPLDADELLVTALPIDDLRKQLLRDGVALIDWKFYHPTEKDPDEKNPFKRMQYTSGTQKHLSKCLIKWRPNMRIYQGNHGIDNPGHFESIRLQGAYVANFPFRSREQAKKKIINNGLSHKNIPDNSETIMSNYKNYLKHGDEFIDAFWKKQIQPSKELLHLPI